MNIIKQTKIGEAFPNLLPEIETSGQSDMTPLKIRSFHYLKEIIVIKGLPKFVNSLKEMLPNLKKRIVN